MSVDSTKVEEAATKMVLRLVFEHIVINGGSMTRDGLVEFFCEMLEGEGEDEDEIADDIDTALGALEHGGFITRKSGRWVLTPLGTENTDEILVELSDGMQDLLDGSDGQEDIYEEEEGDVQPVRGRPH
jgi:hypothetical protein